METQDVFITNDGRQRAINMLEFLLTTRRAEIAQYLHDAKELGVVIDKVVYEEAINEQARFEERIMELERMLSNSKFIDRVQSDVVTLGSTVHLRTGEDREFHLTIMGVFDADPRSGRISDKSPVGKALLGHKAGDMVEVSTPGGRKEYEILSIEGNYSISEKSAQQLPQTRGSSTTTSFSDPSIPKSASASPSDHMEDHSEQQISVTSEDSQRFLSIRIMEEPLTAQNLSNIILAITELHTKCWLILHGRFADLIEYMQTRNPHFEKEAALIIEKLTHNSPAEIKLNLGAKELAEALREAVDGVVQTPLRLEIMKLEVQAKALDLEIKEGEAKDAQGARKQALELEAQKVELDKREQLLALEEKWLAVERKRLEIQEVRLELEKKRVDYALKTARDIVDMLRPGAEQEIKEVLMRTLLPSLLQLGNSQGLELSILPVSGEDQKKLDI